MDKLIEYICDELEELERKAEKGKLSMAEVQYGDMLAHFKKNILTSDAMMEDGEYSNESGSYARGERGRGRNARRDSMGRYSSRRSYEDGSMRDNRGRSYDGYSRDDAREDLRMELHEMEQDAGDEETKRMIKKWIKQLEQD